MGHRAFFTISLLLLSLAGVSLGTSGCQALPPPPRTTLDEQLRGTIVEHGLAGDPSNGRDLPNIEEPLAQLGMKLFFSKALSGDMDTACASCHHPLLGGGDGLSLPIGVGAVAPDVLGPGRVHPGGSPTVPRNSSTTFNIGMWDQVLFHDGRIESLGKRPGMNGSDGLGIRTPESQFGIADPYAGNNLIEAQSRFPVTSVAEMRGFTFEADRLNASVRARLRARLMALENDELNADTWLDEFRQTFSSQLEAEDLITYANIAAALAAYQRSQKFVDTPWKSYVLGNDQAISPNAKRGALLFFNTKTEGGAGCARCHNGDFYSDEQFHVLAIPQIGIGKGDGVYGDDDFGRFRVTGQPEDLYAFRTPTLLNVEATGPYGHDGAYATLEGIVRHHLDPVAAIAGYQPGQLQPGIESQHGEQNSGRALAQLETIRNAGRTPNQDVELSDAQVQDLLSFLLTLTDPCVKSTECLQPWIPDEFDSDPDGLRLDAQIPAVTQGIAMR